MALVEGKTYTFLDRGRNPPYPTYVRFEPVPPESTQFCLKCHGSKGKPVTIAVFTNGIGEPLGSEYMCKPCTPAVLNLICQALAH